jgi:hypothetical protein
MLEAQIREDGLYLSIHHYRHPKLRRRRSIQMQTSEAGRRDPDYREAQTVQNDLLTQQSWIAAEPPLPQAITQHHHWISSGHSILFRKEGTPQRGGQTQNGEVIPAHDFAFEFFSALTYSQTHFGVVVGGQSR